MSRLAIIFVLVCAATVYAKKTCTSGTMGEVCGARRCNEGAPCVNGKCTCSTGKGVGGLSCAGANQKTASNVNDPIAENFNSESAAVDLPCEYLFTDVTTNIVNMPWLQTNPKCKLRMWMANERIKGKQYVSYVKLEVTTTGLPHNVNYTFKIDGQGNAGSYCFWRKVKNGANGDWVNPHNLQIGGIENVAFDIDHDQNKAKIVSSICSFSLEYRPADKTKNVSAQPYVPGAVLKLDNVHGYNNDNITTVLNPSDSFNALTPSGWSKEDLLLYRAITSNANQDQKWKSPQCNGIESVFDDCDDDAAIGNALDHCGYIFRNPPFARCYSDYKNDSKSNKIIKLFRKCVEAFCKEKTNKCQQVQAANDDSECQGHLDSTEPILSATACSF